MEHLILSSEIPVTSSMGRRGRNTNFSGPRRRLNIQDSGRRPPATFPGGIPQCQYCRPHQYYFPEGIPDPWSEVTSWVFNAAYGGTSHLKQTMSAPALHIRRARKRTHPRRPLPEGTCVRDNWGRLLCSQRDSGLNQYGEPNNPVGRLSRISAFCGYGEIPPHQITTHCRSRLGEAGRWAATLYQLHIQPLD